jgi:hypothetical protein
MRFPYKGLRFLGWLREKFINGKLNYRYNNWNREVERILSNEDPMRSRRFAKNKGRVAEIL